MARTFTTSVTPIAPPAATSYWFVCGKKGLVVCDDGGLLRLPTAAELAAAQLDLAAAHYLGRLEDVDCHVLYLSDAAGLPATLGERALRKLYGSLDEELFWLAGRAWQIANWDDTHRFCGRCATPLTRKPTERAKHCPACELTAFPRVSPAVIVLVRRGREALLARSARAPLPFYSTLAGFVEAGESLEETVRREIREEVGIDVCNLRYFGSQPWPFPHSLMVGFVADYHSGELRVDGDEILEAKWFAADALPMIPPPLSIARHLIDAWVREVSAQ